MRLFGRLVQALILAEETPAAGPFPEAASRWLTGTNPEGMFDQVRGRASDRKLRLLACALARRFWFELPHDRVREAVLAAERCACGTATAADLEAARQSLGWWVEAAEIDFREREERYRRTNEDYLYLRRSMTSLDLLNAGIDEALDRELGNALQMRGEARWLRARLLPAWAAVAAEPEEPVAHALRALLLLDWTRPYEGPELATSDPPQERPFLCHLLRDLFANPFLPVAVEPSWLAWNDGTVASLARTIDQEARFVDLPILADALEEAGCAATDLLQHCRQPGEHFPGCWALDLLLSRE